MDMYGKYIRWHYGRYGDPNMAYLQACGVTDPKLIYKYTYAPLRSFPRDVIADSAIHIEYPDGSPVSRENQVTVISDCLHSNRYSLHEIIATFSEDEIFSNCEFEQQATVHIIKQYPYLKWDYSAVLQWSEFMTYEDVMELYHLGFYGADVLPWYSRNSMLQYRTIKAHPEFPWDMEKLKSNYYISTYHMLKNHEYFQIDMSNELDDFLDMNSNIRMIHVLKLKLNDVDPYQFKLLMSDMDRAPLRTMHQDIWNSDADTQIWLSYFILHYYDAPDALARMGLTRRDIVERFNEYADPLGDMIAWDHIPIPFILAHPEFNWHYGGLMMGRANLSVSTVLQYMDRFRHACMDNPTYITYLRDLTISALCILNNMKIPLDIISTHITTHPNITYRDILLHPELPWDRSAIILNPNLTVAEIRARGNVVQPVCNNNMVLMYTGQHDRRVCRRYIQRAVHRRRAEFVRRFASPDPAARHAISCVNVGHLIGAYLTYI
jgi:hypothetical protein